MSDWDELDRQAAAADEAMPPSCKVDIDLSDEAQMAYERDRDPRHGLLVEDPTGQPRPVGVYDLASFERTMSDEERAENERRKSFLLNAAAIDGALDETEEDIAVRAERVEHEHRAAVEAMRLQSAQTSTPSRATARRIWKSVGGPPKHLKPRLRDRLRR